MAIPTPTPSRTGKGNEAEGEERGARKGEGRNGN